MGIEPTSSAWKADILADVLYPQLQNALYHNFAQMSSMNLGVTTVKAVAFLLWEAPFCFLSCKATRHLLSLLYPAQRARADAFVVFYFYGPAFLYNIFSL